eukprot:gnl/TRDRNA2_/TRDRNA2_142981_c1_seq2.p1 gnl/TRDRNA2_/TRDRNA2_142981_c1~~gnl/TRDRNA2_/TRDRNA2_142981_c1_seq2.p1  ORF type:complete len:277 (+),score=32.50 gnl/TRDRNA2_/TRDRNA2_142981_c1_seq2:111-941(+)
MERCCGPDLLDYVEECGGQLSVSTVRSLANQMLGALEAVHAMQIMHRDIKPENFRFHDVEADTLKLLDFGAAKPSNGTPSCHTITGTLLYAAPEVFDAMYCHSCDLWSIGVVLFLLFSGQMPFDTSDALILRSMFKDPVLTGSGLFRGVRWTQVPSGAKSLVRGLLTVDPSQRLSARAALEHRWLSNGDQMTGLHRNETSSTDSLKSLGVKSEGLKRSSNSLNELKRSYYVWNLADAGGDNCYNSESGSETCRSGSKTRSGSISPTQQSWATLGPK